MKHFTLLTILVLFSNGLFAQKITKIKSQDAQSILRNLDQENAVIIDGRTSAMFESGHLKNAVNINAFSEAADDKLSNYLEQKKILVYCTNRNRSETIISKLENLGYNGEIIFVTDGINGWKSNGFKVNKDTSEDVSASQRNKSQELSDKLSPIVQVFGAAAYNIENNRYGYSFGRAHLGFQYQFNKDWSAKIILDRGRPTSVGDITITDTAGNELNVTQPVQEGSFYTMALKFATLAWQVTPKLKIEGGGILQNHYITQERFWGYRYVAKTFQDRYFHTPSGDLGFIVYYHLNETFALDAALTNGEGFRSDQDPYGKVKTAAGLDVNPGSRFQSRIYYAHHPSGVPGDETTQELISLFAGYRIPDVGGIGGEYNYHINHHHMQGKDLHGYSLYGSFEVAKQTSLFARFDRLTSNIPEVMDNPWNHDGNGNAIITGVHHSPVENIGLSLNYEGWIPDNTEINKQHHVMLNFEYKW